MISRRAVEAITFRRVLAALLIGAFWPEISFLLSWLGGIGWGLKSVAALHCAEIASARLLLQAALVYRPPRPWPSPAPAGKELIVDATTTAVENASAMGPGRPGCAEAQKRGGTAPVLGVGGARAMAPRCESTLAVAIGGAPAVDLEGLALEHLLRVGGRDRPMPLARLRVPDRDLVICDPAGVVHYVLLLAGTTAAWEQRTVSYPPAHLLSPVREEPGWDRRSRELCSASVDARRCRVPVGVVAAEARAAEELGDLEDGEETVLRMSEAAAALLQASGKEAAKAGRLLEADVERARRPSHVPLHRLQGALAEEVSLGRSVGAICSRSPGFSQSADGSKAASLLCRRLGLQGTLDADRRLRYARVASAETAVLLCEALDLAPEQVGL